MSVPSNPIAADLHRRIVARRARTGIIGLGYVGLPLAVELGRAGFEVVGIDINEAKCRAINGGVSDIPDVPDAAVAELITKRKLRAVPDLELAGNLDTINICVPTPLRKTKDPDLSFVAAATRAVALRLRAGMLVILESTTYPGATEELVQGILEQTGLRAGHDFFLAFSPERVDPANKTWNITNVPKVLGGVSDDCAALAAALYEGSVNRVVKVSSPRVAEMVKLLENTFRAINIGLVNELAVMCDRLGVSIWEVIDAAATKPFGFMPFYPGPGLGGHCIPIDPLYLSWKVREAGFDARFIDLASEINGAMPHHVVEKVTEALNDRGKPINGSSILIMGVAYKPEVSDVRESPALDLIALLENKGATVSYHDPFVPVISAGQWNRGTAMESISYRTDVIAAADCVVVATNHAGVDYAELAETAQLIVDTRNAIDTSTPNVYKLGAPSPARESNLKHDREKITDRAPERLEHRYLLDDTGNVRHNANRTAKGGTVSPRE